MTHTDAPLKSYRVILSYQMGPMGGSERFFVRAADEVDARMEAELRFRNSRQLVPRGDYTMMGIEVTLMDPDKEKI